MQTAERESSVPDNASVSRALASLSSRMSIEIVPREVLSGARSIDLIPAGTNAFIPRLPKGSEEETLRVAVELARRGLRPVPHVTARTTESAVSLGRYLDRLVRGGVEQILLIAGSDVKPAGSYSNVLPLLESDIVSSSGLQGVYVAGHPEGHPDAGHDELRRALMIKNEFAARSGLAVKIVSQFFFDAAPVVAWERRIRSQGNVLPVIPGLHGCTGTAGLIKHAVACGVGASLKALTSKGVGLLQLTHVQAPDDLAGDIANASARDPESRFGGFHLFPLGGLAKTIEWADNLRRGNYVFDEGKLTVGI